MSTKVYINPYKMFTGIFIPDWLLETDKISYTAKMMYGILSRYAGNDGYCFPSQEQIAERMGVTTRSARKYIKELTDIGLIEQKRNGLSSNNTYYFLQHELMGFTDDIGKMCTSEPERSGNGMTQSFRSHIGIRESIKENNNISDRSAFIAPTLEEVKDYFIEYGGYDDSKRFVSFYESKGWKVGKQKMVDWKASVRYWVNNSKSKQKNNGFSYDDSHRIYGRHDEVFK